MMARRGSWMQMEMGELDYKLTGQIYGPGTDVLQSDDGMGGTTE